MFNLIKEFFLWSSNNFRKLDKLEKIKKNNNKCYQLVNSNNNNNSNKTSIEEYKLEEALSS